MVRKVVWIPGILLLGVVASSSSRIVHNHKLVNDSMTRSDDGTMGRLLVANKGDHTLSVIDPSSGRQLAAIPVGGVTGHEVAASPDGRTAWVPIYGNSAVGNAGTDGQSISVIDLAALKQVATIDLGKPSRPHCAVFNRKDGKLYVTAELTRSVAVIDPAARKIVGSIPTGAPESHMLVISSDGQRGYTANVAAGSVSVLDLTNRKTLAVIPISSSVQRISISPDNRWVSTSDQSKPELVVIDTATQAVKSRIPLPALGFGTAPTADGRYLLVAHPGSKMVSVVNLAENKVERTISVPPEPQEILIRPDGQVAYVSCDQSKQVVAIDLNSWRVVKTFAAGAAADGLAWALK